MNIEGRRTIVEHRGAIDERRRATAEGVDT